MIRSFRSALALSAVAVTLTSQPVRAQDAAPVSGPPPLDCAKPGDPPKPGASNADITRFQKRLDEYKTCVSTYTKANAAKAQEYQAQARAYSDAANGAVDGFNAYVTELNQKRQDAEKK
jgi:hypothetical protein